MLHKFRLPPKLAFAGVPWARFPVILGISVILVIAVAEPAASYLDPGGFQVVWGSLAPIIGMLSLVAAGGLWMFRRTVWVLLVNARKLALSALGIAARLLRRNPKSDSIENNAS